MKRGELLWTAEVWAFILLVGIAMLFFGVFLLQASRFEDRIADQSTIEESLAQSEGASVLQTYLLTRMDEPVGKFTDQAITINPYPVTFGNALSRVMNDPVCAKAINQLSANYPAVSLPESMDDFQIEAGDFCRSFVLRSFLFFQSFSHENQFSVEIILPLEQHTNSHARVLFGEPGVRNLDPGAGLLRLSSDEPYPQGDVTAEQVLPNNMKVRMLVRGVS